ncbi:MAG: ATP-binding protein [Cyclobacteriaceae bacterium]
MPHKIAIVGPESSGKSVLAEQLSSHFSDSILVKEYARKFLENLGRPYAKEDLIAIADGQLIAEEEAINQNPELIICDTDILEIKVWSDYKYGSCDERINVQIMKFASDFYLLAKPDLPWEPDPLRENPEDRDELFDFYIKSLERLGLPYGVVSGEGEARLQCAINALSRFGIT